MNKAPILRSRLTRPTHWILVLMPWQNSEDGNKNYRFGEEFIVDTQDNSLLLVWRRTDAETDKAMHRKLEEELS